MSTRILPRKAIAILAPLLIGCGSAETETTPGVTCDPSAAEGIVVSTNDPYGGLPYALGYPPYAVDACALVYVAEPVAGASGGELRLRDLSTDKETVLAPAGDLPRRPVIAGDLVAWEATIAGRAVIRVREGGAIETLAGAFDHAGEPRVAPDAVVFTGWLTADDQGDTDVFLYRPKERSLTAIAAGPGQQRFADVSATHVAWSDFSEGASGIFTDASGDAADIVVLDRATNMKTARAREGKQAFPILGAEGKIAYLDWGLVHPEPKFSEYEVRLGDLAGPVESEVVAAHVTSFAPYVRPAARGSQIAWVQAVGGVASLFYRDVDPSASAELVGSFDSGKVFGPSAADSLVLVGASNGGNSGKVELRAFAR